MKTGIITTLIALYSPVSVFATTLQFSADVDLLVFDGKRVSSSLLHDADNIEPDNRPHQPVFRVEKAIRFSNSKGWLHISSPLVANFDAQLISQISSRPPHLEDERGASHFDVAPRLELLNDDVTPIPVKLGILAIISTVKAIDYRVKVERYNKSAERAPLPQSATMMASDSMLLPGVSELDTTPPQSQVLTEQRLRCQFELTDPQTRDIFLQQVEKQPFS